MYKCYLIPSLLIVSLILSGCSSFSGYPNRPQYMDAAVKKFSEHYGDTALTDYIALADDKKKEYRDNVVNAWISEIDLNYDAFKEALRKEGILLDTTTDVSIIGLDLAGTLVGGSSVKAMLAAASTGLTGSKASFDRSVYFKKTITALMAKMDAERKQVLVKIRTGLSEPTSRYSLPAAYSDVKEYYYAGTIPGAISAVSKTAGVEEAEADKKLEQILTYGPDKNSEWLKSYVGWDGERFLNEENNKNLRAWMNSRGLQEEFIAFFLDGTEYRDMRHEAVKDLRDAVNKKLLTEFLGWDGTRATKEGNWTKLLEWIGEQGVSGIAIKSLVEDPQFSEVRRNAVSAMGL